jgi:hypothetical protein
MLNRDIVLNSFLNKTRGSDYKLKGGLGRGNNPQPAVKREVTHNILVDS